jgi:hypothetical protein
VRRDRPWASVQNITKYRELWLRLMDIFPTVMMDMERGGDAEIIQYETYRYRAVVAGDGYMVWVLPSTPSFWEKAILPILSEYAAERVTWSKHRYNPRAFLVKLPMNPLGVQNFREWAKSGSTDTLTFVREHLYDDGWAYADDDYWSYQYEDDLDQMDEQFEEIAEKFEKKARSKNR